MCRWWYTGAMQGWELVLYGTVCLAVSVVSGIAGAGGGFILTPLGIFLGLTPAQAVSTGKFNGLSASVGSLWGMRSARGQVSLARVLPVMGLAFGIGLLAPLVIKSLDNDIYRIVLGVILLLMIPVMLLKRVGLHRYRPTLWQKTGGGILLSLALMLQGVFSGGLGTLVNIVLMGMLGMTAVEANITKRWSQLILNGTIILGVVGSGLVLWHVAAVGVCTTLVGSYFGGKLAVRRGDAFVMRVMVVLMFISAMLLIFGGWG